MPALRWASRRFSMTLRRDRGGQWQFVPVGPLPKSTQGRSGKKAHPTRMLETDMIDPRRARLGHLLLVRQQKRAACTMEGLCYPQRVCPYFLLSLNIIPSIVSYHTWLCRTVGACRRMSKEEGERPRFAGAGESTVPKAARRERGILLTRYRLQQHAKNEGKVVRMMPALSNETRPSQQ